MRITIIIHSSSEVQSHPLLDVYIPSESLSDRRNCLIVGIFRSQLLVCYFDMGLTPIFRTFLDRNIFTDILDHEEKQTRLKAAMTLA